MKPTEIKTVTFRDWHTVKTIKDTARKLQMNGKSRIYSDKDKRLKNLSKNQLTGQAGEAAGCSVLYGFQKYEERADEIKNTFRLGKGDDGNDINGSSVPIDVKTSCVEIDDLMKIYHTKDILVTEPEFSPNSIYVACLLNKAPTYMDRYFTVYVMGWCWGREMVWCPSERRVTGFRKDFKKLHSIESMNWNRFLEVA